MFTLRMVLSAYLLIGVGYAYKEFKNWNDHFGQDEKPFFRTALALTVLTYVFGWPWIMYTIHRVIKKEMEKERDGH